MPKRVGALQWPLDQKPQDFVDFAQRRR